MGAHQRRRSTARQTTTIGLLLVLLCLLPPGSARADTYRTAHTSGTHVWQDPANWERWTGSTWEPATTWPGEGDDVTIRGSATYTQSGPGQSVSCRDLTIESNARLRAPGPDDSADWHVSGALVCDGVFSTPDATSAEYRDRLFLEGNGLIEDSGALHPWFLQVQGDGVDRTLRMDAVVRQIEGGLVLLGAGGSFTIGAGTTLRLGRADPGAGGVLVRFDDGALLVEGALIASDIAVYATNENHEARLAVAPGGSILAGFPGTGNTLMIGNGTLRAGALELLGSAGSPALLGGRSTDSYWSTFEIAAHSRLAARHAVIEQLDTPIDFKAQSLLDPVHPLDHTTLRSDHLLSSFLAFSQGAILPQTRSVASRFEALGELGPTGNILTFSGVEGYWELYDAWGNRAGEEYEIDACDCIEWTYPTPTPSPWGTRPPSPTATPRPSSTPVPPSATPSPTSTPSPTPTASPLPPTPSPRPSPTPSATPWPINLGVRLQMPAHYFSPGDTCSLDATLYNAGGPRSNIALFVILDVYGRYWFWDDWQETLDYETIDLDTSARTIPIIPTFQWPDTGSQQAQGLAFWGAMLESNLQRVLGGDDGIDRWEFAYGPP
jgi:cell division septation protein DedD